ncbi:hypothetical protein L2E82_15941 [Cichorium intybus]|uniref:Uncharacterized protein n=1 Tax=Cichorium intybus TaxID=13427 RepID=A0ACB9F4M2_CICIN|nr:hypothetical protein L2E82_15941 [Cichorium intybus]
MYLYRKKIHNTTLTLRRKKLTRKVFFDSNRYSRRLGLESYLNDPTENWPFGSRNHLNLSTEAENSNLDMISDRP